MKKVWNKFLMFRTLNFRNKDELLPIPKHLKQIFLPIGKFIEDYEVTGKIICECGNDDFKIKIIGDDTNYQIDKIIQTIGLSFVEPYVKQKKKDKIQNISIYNKSKTKNDKKGGVK